MKHSFIIKSYKAEICDRLTFETILDFESSELIKLLKLYTPYNVLEDNPKIKVFSETKLISLESAILYLKHLKFYYEESVIKTRKKLTPIVSFHCRYCPFEIHSRLWKGYYITFFEDLPYSMIRDYSITFEDTIKELFSSYEVKVSKKGNPYIRERLKLTIKNNIVIINKVIEESYIEKIRKVAEY